MKTNKRIAIIIPSLGMGGAERVASELANEMLSRNIYVHFFLLDNDDIYYDLDKKVKIDFVEFDSNKNRLSRNIYRIKKLRNLLKINSIDVVISFLTSANFLSILSTINLKVKVFVSERSNPNIDSKKIKFMRNCLYRMADGCVFQTVDAINIFRGKIKKNGIVIENPVKKGLPKWNSVKKHNDSIVTACRLEESKNIPMLLYSFSAICKKYSNYKLFIYGDGPEKDNLNQLINKYKLNNNVFLEGKNANWHNEAIKSKIFILTSNYEGMSNSLLEALSMGIPTISTDHPIGGARALIVNSKNGFLIPINDTEVLTQKMFELIENSELQKKFSIEAEKINEKFDIKNITDKWLDYILKE